MRVSTSMLFGNGSEAIGRQQAEWLRTQQQLSAGRRVLVPSDDPVASAQAMRAEQGRSRADQQLANQASARASLALAESVLGAAGDALQDARALLVQANSPVLGDADRHAIAVELRGRFDQLLALANTRDEGGDYLFSGYQGATQAFVATSSGATYQGDEGERTLEVAESRTIAVSASGARLFERVPGGNGTFTVTPGAGNTGSAVHDGGSVFDRAALTGHRYRVQFSVAGGVTTYSVADLTSSSTLASGVAYSPGAALRFDGIALTLTGSPANGDTIDIAPSAPKSVFATLRELATLLDTAVSGAAGQAALVNGLVTGMDALDQAAERVLESRTRMGASLRELDGLQGLVESVKLQHAGEVSRLTDLDYAEAASRFAAQQTALEAAQRSYQRLTSLSLFDLL